MSMDDLDQALLLAKLGDAEEDATAVVAKLLGLDRKAVIRVWRAIVEIPTMRLNIGTPDFDSEVPANVQTAMSAQLRRGLLRTLVRKAILGGKPMFTSPHDLGTEVHEICRGCAFSLTCVVGQLSTPATCFRVGPPQHIEEGPPWRITRAHGTPVFPARIRGDVVTVECAHPAGTYDVDVGVLRP